MEIPIANLTKWCQMARKLSEEERYAFMKATYAQKLPQKFKDRIDVGWLLSSFAWLRGQGQCSSEDLMRFFANPIDSIDHLIPIFDTLVFYGHLDLVDEVMEQCYEKVKNSDKMWGRAESDFREAAFMLKFQQAYQKQLGGDLGEIVAYLASYDYEFTPEQVREMVGHVSLEMAGTGFAIDKAVTHEDIMCLSMLFPKCLYVQTGLNFQIGSILWYAATDMCPLVDAVTDESITFGEVFAPNEEAFEAYIGERLYFLSNKQPHAIGVLWGLPYFYDFLLAHELIPKELHTRTLELVEGAKREVIEFRTDELWKYDFVHAWPVPKSVDPAQFAREAQLFRRTLAERIGIEELVEEGFVPVERPQSW